MHKMGSLNPDSETKQEFDDSGYVQEENKESPKESVSDEYQGGTELLDLSDDVLLYILKHCSPMDLKALGFTCNRLASLVLDRTLWQRVDARERPCGPRRVRWFMAHGIGYNTTAILFSGYAKDDKCPELLNEEIDEGASGDGPSVQPSTSQSQSTNEEPKKNPNQLHIYKPTFRPIKVKKIQDPSEQPGPSGAGRAPPSGNQGAPVAEQPARPNRVLNGVVPPPRRPSNPEEERRLPPRMYRLTTQSMPRYGNQIPYWPENLFRNDHPSSPSPRLPSNGPQVTMTACALEHLSALCPKLEELALEYCIIDCGKINLSMFPNYLKKVSFRGSKCYNMDKSFLFKIQDYLPELEELDLSYCEWVEPACMLPLSKLPNLHTLSMVECPKLSEFVAYASLATRYGFKALKVLDLRGSPVGDSEVSALGWLPQLEKLLLSRAPSPRESIPAPVLLRTELDPWEEHEPEFFRNKRHNHAWLYDEPYYKSKSKQNQPKMDGHVVLERMVAEPVAPEEYGNVYQTFLATTKLPTGVTLVPPDQYKDAYASYFKRNRNGNDNDEGLKLIHSYRPLADIRVPVNDDNENPNDGPSPAKRAKVDEACAGPSKLPSENTTVSSIKPSNDDQTDNADDSDDGQPKTKRQCLKVPNDAPSTSKSQENPTNTDGPSSSSSCQKAEATSSEPKKQRYVRFRQYQAPIVVEEMRSNCNNNDNTNNNNDEHSEQNNNGPDEAGTSNNNREPKHRILFVNVGRRHHAMYHLSLPVCTVTEPVDLRTNNAAPNSRNVSPLIYTSQLTSRLDHGALVTDSAIRRFGRADGENVSYVTIGPNGPVPAPQNDPNARPNRSNLRVLSATGFRNITNTSLVHLATAAPHLRYIDFTGTSVTRAGVENFKSLRPDCVVRFSEHDETDKEAN